MQYIHRLYSTGVNPSPVVIGMDKHGVLTVDVVPVKDNMFCSQQLYYIISLHHLVALIRLLIS